MILGQFYKIIGIVGDVIGKPCKPTDLSKKISFRRPFWSIPIRLRAAGLTKWASGINCHACLTSSAQNNGVKVTVKSNLNLINTVLSKVGD